MRVSVLLRQDRPCSAHFNPTRCDKQLICILRHADDGGDGGSGTAIAYFPRLPLSLGQLVLADVGAGLGGADRWSKLELGGSGQLLLLCCFESCTLDHGP